MIDLENNGPCTCADPTKVHEVWAYVAEDADGEEGIIVFPFPNGPLPLIGADRERMQSIRDLAQQVATIRNKTVELRRYHLVESDIDVIQPQ